jgi:hypothetical protein
VESWYQVLLFPSDLSDIIEGFKNPPGVPICRWGLSSKIGKVMTFRHLWKRVHSSLLHANHLLGLLNETDCRRDYHSFLLSKLTVTDNSKLNWIFVAFEFWWRMSIEVSKYVRCDWLGMKLYKLKKMPVKR